MDLSTDTRESLSSDVTLKLKTNFISGGGTSLITGCPVDFSYLKRNLRHEKVHTRLIFCQDP